jgi:hypothetical protein
LPFVLRRSAEIRLVVVRRELLGVILVVDQTKIGAEAVMVEAVQKQVVHMVVDSQAYYMVAPDSVVAVANIVVEVVYKKAAGIGAGYRAVKVDWFGKDQSQVED